MLSKPETQKKFPCFVLAPTCQPRESWWKAKGIRAKPRMPDVLELIDKLIKELPIDEKRIYVTGHSLGGFGTYGALIARPKLFAAAVPSAGGSDPAMAEKIAHVPIWIFHGKLDKGVPVAWGREMAEALTKAGGKPKYTEYPDLGHNVSARAYNTEELWEWMFAQERK